MKSFLKIQRRQLALHEYQSMNIFRKFSIPVPNFYSVNSLEEATRVGTTNFSNDKEIVIKAQVLAGGRGLGKFKENNFFGGVQIVKNNPQKIEEIVKKMLNKTLVTKQTGEAGKPCNTLLFVEKFVIVKEKYFAVLMDRSSGGPLMIGSKTGGTSIEEIAEKNPSAIVKIPVSILDGSELSQKTAEEMAKQMEFAENEISEAAKTIRGLYRMFIENDCTMVEINPLAVLDDSRVMVCDGKVNFDDNAEFRQKEIFAQRDFSQEDPREVDAAKYDLNYIGLDGQIACLVNGAGLAMATMDLLTFHGGRPSNFLDVGGSASKEQIVAAFRILDADVSVRSIFVNILGGILRCDIMAQGLVEACRELKMKKPIVLRLVGTKVDEGRDIIRKSGLNLFAEDDLDKAAKLSVKLSK